MEQLPTLEDIKMSIKELDKKLPTYRSIYIIEYLERSKQDDEDVKDE